MKTRACLGDDGTTTAARSATEHPHHTRPRRRALALVAAAAVALACAPVRRRLTRRRRPGRHRHRRPRLRGGRTNPTVTKAESKVWFQDGSWYAAMLKTGTPTTTGRPNADFYIYRLTAAPGCPPRRSSTTGGPPSSTSSRSGNTLYVTSHKSVDERHRRRPDRRRQQDQDQQVHLRHRHQHLHQGRRVPEGGEPLPDGVAVRSTSTAAVAVGRLGAGRQGVLAALDRRRLHRGRRPLALTDPDAVTTRRRHRQPRRLRQQGRDHVERPGPRPRRLLLHHRRGRDGGRHVVARPSRPTSAPTSATTTST